MRSFMSELTIIYIFRCVSVTFFGCSSFAKGFAIYIRMCHCVAHIYFVDSQPIDVRGYFRFIFNKKHIKRRLERYNIENLLNINSNAELKSLDSYEYICATRLYVEN